MPKKRKTSQEDRNYGDVLMTLEQVAEYLQVAPRTVYLWAQEGRIPSFKLGNLWRFKLSDLEAWFEEQKKQTPRKE